MKYSGAGLYFDFDLYFDLYCYLCLSFKDLLAIFFVRLFVVT